MSKQTRRGLIIIGLGITPFLVLLLFTFQIIRIPFPTDMADSPAVDYMEGPRWSPPDGAVPVQGEAVIAEEFPVNPIPPDDDSLQRGKILYQINCGLCHGDLGHGDGPLAGYFARTPENLVGTRAAAEFDGSVFLVIRQGYGQMPGLNEQLTVREQWDVINYIRTLPLSGE